MVLCFFSLCWSSRARVCRGHWLEPLRWDYIFAVAMPTNQLLPPPPPPPPPSSPPCGCRSNGASALREAQHRIQRCFSSFYFSLNWQRFSGLGPWPGVFVVLVFGQRWHSGLECGASFPTQLKSKPDGCSVKVTDSSQGWSINNIFTDADILLLY